MFLFRSKDIKKLAFSLHTKTCIMNCERGPVVFISSRNRWRKFIFIGRTVQFSQNTGRGMGYHGNLWENVKQQTLTEEWFFHWNQR